VALAITFTVERKFMMRERFLVKSFGDNEEGSREGLEKAIDLLKKYDSLVIVVPTIGKIKDSMLTNLLNPELAKKLIKDRELLFQNNKKISLCAQSAVKNYRNADVFLDLWGNKFSIQDIEALHHCKAVILVTWGPDDCAEWEKQHPVTVIYDDGKKEL
jgi:5'-3' exonuclease